MWGSCFWFCIPASSRPPPPPGLLLPPPPPPAALTYNNFTHTNLTHTNLTHTNLTYNNTQQHQHTHNNTQQHQHTHNTHTPTHTNTHQHTTTHNNTQQHTTTHNNTQQHTTPTHTQHPHTQQHTTTTHTNTWQAWHTHTTHNTNTHTQHTHNTHTQHTHTHTDNLTSTFVSRGRRGTNGTGWRAWTGLGACDAAALCVAGVAQTHTYCRFTWQAWHKLTSTVVLRGKRGTNSHPPSFCVAGVAGVALMALGGALGLAWAPVTPRHFAWQAWHKLTPTVVLRGRRGTNSHPPSFYVAGVALMALGGVLGLAWAPVTPRHFAWQAWHKLTPTVVSRGRRGTNSHLLSFCVAGVAQTHIHRRFAWQAWHSWHWVARLDWLGRLWRHGTLRGRRGTNSHLLSFCVAGVAQTHIHRRFAWQAWYRWHWVARLDWLGRLWRRGTLRGRRGTNSHLLSFCVAGVAQTHIHRRFAWQAWYRWHWVARLDWLGRPWRRGTLRGRRATTWHPPSFHVAGVAQTHIHRRFAWQAWYRWHWVARLDWLGRPWRRGTLRGRRATTWHPPSFHVAGVAQTHIHLCFTWQAWHSWHWVACLDWLGRPWRRGTLRGRRGTNSHLLSFCVAGVAQTHIHRRFTWQAWHSWHWVACLDWLGRLWRCGTLRGRRGTNSHPPLFHVAGVALMALGGVLGLAWAPVTPRHFAWQAWHKLTPTVKLTPTGLGAMVWRNVQRTMLIDIARMWPGVYALTGLTLACSQREKVGGYAACQCLHWPPFMSCTVLC